MCVCVFFFFFVVFFCLFLFLFFVVFFLHIFGTKNRSKFSQILTAQTDSYSDTHHD